MKWKGSEVGVGDWRGGGGIVDEVFLRYYPCSPAGCVEHWISQILNNTYKKLKQKKGGGGGERRRSKRRRRRRNE